MSRGQSSAPAIKMTDLQREILREIAVKHNSPQQQAKRSTILLLANEGISNSEVKRRVGVCLNTVKSWRRKWTKAYEGLKKHEIFVDRGQSHIIEYRKEVEKVLKDLPRSGAPKVIRLSQVQQIVA